MVQSACENVQAVGNNQKGSTSRPPRWCIEDFEVGKKLGKGRFGNVYLVREKRTKYVVALKVRIAVHVPGAEFELRLGTRSRSLHRHRSGSARSQMRLSAYWTWG
jgi:hypothetical protein